jgi:hypothetical protein
MPFHSRRCLRHAPEVAGDISRLWSELRSVIGRLEDRNAGWEELGRRSQTASEGDRETQSCFSHCFRSVCSRDTKA